MKTESCELCGEVRMPFDLVVMLNVPACCDCLYKLDQPITLDGGVSSPSWQSIVDAHMESHERWRQRMVQLAKDICGSDT